MLLCGNTGAERRNKAIAPYGSRIVVESAGAGHVVDCSRARNLLTAWPSGGGNRQEVGTTSARPSGPREIPDGLSIVAVRLRACPQHRDRQHIENFGRPQAPGPRVGCALGQQLLQRRKTIDQTVASQSCRDRPAAAAWVERLNSRATMTRTASPSWQRAKATISSASRPLTSSGR